jgi:hypothetical protein
LRPRVIVSFISLRAITGDSGTIVAGTSAAIRPAPI